MLPTFLTALATLLAFATAHASHPPHLRHRRALGHARDAEQHPGRAHLPPRANTAHAEAKRAIKKNVKKRGTTCQARDSSSADTTSYSSSASWSSSTDVSWSDTASSADATVSAVAAVETQESSWSSTSAAPSSTESTLSAWQASATSSEGDSWDISLSASVGVSVGWSEGSSSTATSSAATSTSSGSLLTVTDDTCGYSNADDDSPNGTEDWLNCGLSGSGWTPPSVTVDQLISQDLSADGVFSECADYIDKFNQYADQYNLKGIMLASFAMQESTCNPSATGGNGEAGLMQLASENCDDAPSGNCYDVDFNIERGAKLFSELVTSNDNNVLLAIGSYNGWYSGLTVSSGEAAASEGDCSAQNNLDYIHQFCNGWMQGKTGSDLGTYFNLASCS